MSKTIEERSLNLQVIKLHFSSIHLIVADKLLQVRKFHMSPFLLQKFCSNFSFSGGVLEEGQFFRGEEILLSKISRIQLTKDRNEEAMEYLLKVE